MLKKIILGLIISAVVLTAATGAIYAYNNGDNEILFLNRGNSLKHCEKNEYCERNEYSEKNKYCERNEYCERNLEEQDINKNLNCDEKNYRYKYEIRNCNEEMKNNSVNTGKVNGNQYGKNK